LFSSVNSKLDCFTRF